MSRFKLSIFEDRIQLQNFIRKALAQYSADVLKQKSRFRLAIAGGSVPGLLFDATALEDLATNAWSIALADERCVENSHPDSNYRLIQESLNIKERPEILKSNDSLPPEERASDYANRLRASHARQSDAVPKFDLLVLGMGPDGHIASLFPGHRLLEEKNKIIASILDSPKPPPARITFTFPVILAAREIWLVVVGAQKASALAAAMKTAQKGQYGLPVAQLSQGNLRVFCDHSAAEIDSEFIK